MIEKDVARSARVRVLCYIHAAELGGVERVAVRLCAAWSGACDVTLAVGRVLDDREIAPSVKVLAAPRLPLVPAVLETPWMIWWLCRLVRRERPDIVFCPGNTYTIVAVAIRLLMGGNCPPIVAKVSNPLERGDLPKLARMVLGWWARIQGRAIDHFVALTSEMKPEIMRSAQANAARVSVIANPAFDRGRYEALEKAGEALDRRSGDARVFVAIGRLVPQKNFGLLLAAFALGARPTDSLFIVGAGPERSRLRRAIRARGLDGRVSLVGHQQNVVDWIARSDALILSSRYEGLPSVVLEAMAAGVPVIATYCCSGMSALLGHGRRGLLVPTGDVNGLARAIGAFDPGTYDRLDAKRFAAGFTTDQIARSYVTLFRALVERASSARDTPIFVSSPASTT